jgi:hypothetical protein
VAGLFGATLAILGMTLLAIGGIHHQSGVAELPDTGKSVAQLEGTGGIPAVTSPDALSPVDGLPFNQPMEFWFSSGVGAWSSGLRLNPEGDFIGIYTDTNLGEQGSGYPNGTVYIQAYKGRFDVVQKVSDTEYLLQMNDLSLEYAEGQSWFSEGQKYIGSGPYGLEGDGVFRLYLPGHPTTAFSDDLIGWVFPHSEFNEQTLTFARTPLVAPFLVNVQEDLGWNGQVATGRQFWIL